MCLLKSATIPLKFSDLNFTHDTNNSAVCIILQINENQFISFSLDSDDDTKENVNPEIETKRKGKMLAIQ